MWKNKEENGMLTVKDHQNFIASLKEFAGNDIQIQFVGGEPLLKKGIIELIEYTTKQGFSTTMTTNGFLFNAENRERIANSGLNSLVFSLESLKQKTHDFLRGQKGVHKRIMETIEYFETRENCKAEIFIASIIMNDNLGDILELTEWVNGKKRISSVYFQAIMQPFGSDADNYWYESKDYRFLWPDIDIIDNILDELIRLKIRGYKIANQIPQLQVYKSYFRNPQRFIKKSKCSLGYKSFTVLSNGDIYLCLSMPSIGNIKTDKMDKLWFSEKANRIRQQIASCRQNCKLLINCFFEEEACVNTQPLSLRKDFRNGAKKTA